MINGKRKGARAEHKAMRILETAGYTCVRAAASLGPIDVIAFGPTGIRCLQVKSGQEYCSQLERERIRALVLPTNATREVWRFPDRCKEPSIEVL